MANFLVPAGAKPLGPINALIGSQPTQVTDVSPSFWFSPLQPVTPTAPSDYKPRQYAYQPGANLIWQPKSDESGYDYTLLRALAENWDLLRIALQMKRYEVINVDYEVRLKRQDNEKEAEYKKRAASGAKGLAAVKEFWKKPDGFHRWRRWLGMLVEDMLVIDAMSVWLARDTKGRVASLMPVDGATWNRLLTDQGITPQEPNSAAFQQVVYGFSAMNATVNDVVYAMQNERTFRRYGYSRVEQILNTIAFGMRRQTWQLSEYTVGNIPEAFLFMPSNIPPQRLKEFQDYIDSILSGNLENRRKIRMMPGFGDSGKPNIVFPKEALLKDELDVWLAQLVCACVGVSAQPFLKMVNRASAEEANDAAREKMLKADVDHVCDFANDCMERMGLTDYEMAAKSVRDTDPVKQAQADKLNFGLNQTANEQREARGDDPVEGKNANRLGQYSASLGIFVPMDPDEEDLTLIERMKATKTPGNQPDGSGSAPPSGGKTPKPKPQKLLGTFEKGYSYGCVMAPIDPISEAGIRMKVMRDAIADEDLMPGNNDGKTREEDPHVTVRYGIKDDNIAGVLEYLTKQKPFTITFGKTKAFQPSQFSNGAAPLVIEIQGAELNRINGELPDHADFKPANFTYSPHASLAYIKPETAEKYIGDDYLEGVEYPVRSIQVSTKDDEIHEVMLTGGLEKAEHHVKAGNVPNIDAAAHPSEVDAGFAAKPGTSQSSTVEVAHADHAELQGKVLKFFKAQSAATLDRLKRVGELHKSLRKGDDKKADELLAAASDIPWAELPNLIQPELNSAGLLGVISGLHQLSVAGVADVTAHIGKSQELAANYAANRAAEMVGMKWVDGELIENPDARWAISETTRNDLRELITQALEEETSIDDLAKRIQDASVFSEARAEMIAQTEVARAQTEGVTGSWLQTGAVEKVRWSPSSLGPCDECADNVAAGSIPFGQEFPSGDVAPPGHPRCRCALIITKVRNREEKQ